MPLTALFGPTGSAEETWTLIDITKIQNPRGSLTGAELHCPECKSTMHIRGGVLKIVHFAHNPRQSLNCALRQGESIRHLLAKAQVARDIASLDAYSGAEILKEVWLPEINRRADIAALWPDGPLDVHEIQLAAITREELQARTNDYRAAGAVEIVWWFGNAANTADNRRWAYEHCGGYGTLKFTDLDLHPA